MSAAVAPARPHHADRPGEGRARAERDDPARGAGHVQPPADPPRPADLHRPQPPLRRLRAERLLPVLVDESVPLSSTDGRGVTRCRPGEGLRDGGNPVVSKSQPGSRHLVSGDAGIRRLASLRETAPSGAVSAFWAMLRSTTRSALDDAGSRASSRRDACTSARSASSSAASTSSRTPLLYRSAIDVTRFVELFDRGRRARRARPDRRSCPVSRGQSRTEISSRAVAGTAGTLSVAHALRARSPRLHRRPRSRLPRPRPATDAPVAAVREILADVQRARRRRACASSPSGSTASSSTTSGFRLPTFAPRSTPLRRRCATRSSDAAEGIADFHSSAARDRVQLRARRHRRAHDRPCPSTGPACYVPGGRAVVPVDRADDGDPGAGRGRRARSCCACRPTRDRQACPTSTLAAAAIAGVDEVYAIGGAQAIAAMAYGTESIRAGRRHRRPGQRLRGASPSARSRARASSACPSAFAGPSEVVVVADDTTARRARRDRRDRAGRARPRRPGLADHLVTRRRPTLDHRGDRRASSSARPGATTSRRRSPRAATSCWSTGPSRRWRSPT